MRVVTVVAGMMLAVATAIASSEVSPESADVYLLNDSGRTLIPSDQVVTDNGQKIASLPRQTYVKLQLAPGVHLLNTKVPNKKRQVSLDVVAGKTYFVVVAYKPGRSWAAPFGGDPLLLREITEQEAAPLLREMKAQ